VATLLNALEIASPIPNAPGWDQAHTRIIRDADYR
jgi:hypothetical protein